MLSRDYLKALCYKDIKLIVIEDYMIGKDILAIVVKFIHYKGENNKPKL